MIFADQFEVGPNATLLGLAILSAIGGAKWFSEWITKREDRKIAELDRKKAEEERISDRESAKEIAKKVHGVAELLADENQQAKVDRDNQSTAINEIANVTNNTHELVNGQYTHILQSIADVSRKLANMSKGTAESQQNNEAANFAETN